MPLLTPQQFKAIRPHGVYRNYVSYVQQKRRQRAPALANPWSAGPVRNGGAAATQAVIDRSTGMAGVLANDPGAVNTGAGHVGEEGSVPPVTPPPTTRTVPGHWTNPDYEALLRGDPRFIAGQTALTANKGSAATKRAQAIKNAIIHFGGVPKDWTSGYGDINQADIAAAQENPFSTMALANAQRGRAGADLQAELAGRGILSSGALTGGQNMVQNAYESGLNTDTNTLLGVLGGAETGYGTDIGGLDTDWLNLQAQIGAGIQAGNPNQWIPDYEEPI